MTAQFLCINDALLGELREVARTTQRPFRKVLEETLQRGLGNRSPKTPKDRRVKISPHAGGIKPAIRAMSMNQLYDQIEAEGDSTLR